jgi:hypothetical protein
LEGEGEETTEAATTTATTTKQYTHTHTRTHAHTQTKRPLRLLAPNVSSKGPFQGTTRVSLSSFAISFDTSMYLMQHRHQPLSDGPFTFSCRWRTTIDLHQYHSKHYFRWRLEVDYEVPLLVSDSQRLLTTTPHDLTAK